MADLFCGSLEWPTAPRFAALGAADTPHEYGFIVTVLAMLVSVGLCEELSNWLQCYGPCLNAKSLPAVTRCSLGQCLVSALVSLRGVMYSFGGYMPAGAPLSTYLVRFFGVAIRRMRRGRFSLRRYCFHFERRSRRRTSRTHAILSGGSLACRHFARLHPRSHMRSMTRSLDLTIRSWQGEAIMLL